MFTRSEENHIKAIHGLLADGGQAFTKDIAGRLSTRSSSVTDILKKLAAKGVVNHAPYHGATLTARGRRHALTLVRRHRLRETFLVERLGFAWDEVHEVAEQLEHVSSDQLIERLEAYLGHPRFDPHGDHIPDREGRMPKRASMELAGAAVGQRLRLLAVKDGSDALLRLLDDKGLSIGRVFTLAARQEFDGSLQLTWRGGGCDLSAHVASHLLTAPERP